MSRRILVKCCYACRQLYPRMPAAVVDRRLRRRKARVRERTHRDAHKPGFALLRVEEIRAAHRTKPEDEARALIAGAHVFGRRACNLVGSGETGQCSEDAASSPLASEAMTNADTARLALNLNAQLPTRTDSTSLEHSLTPHVVRTQRNDGTCMNDTSPAAEQRHLDSAALKEAPQGAPDGSGVGDG